MITIETNFREQAKKKIDDDMKKIKDEQQKALSDMIAISLKDFAEQDNEFAKSIVEGDSFEKCIKTVFGSFERKSKFAYTPDITAIRKAVNFYFKGATVNFTMTISVNPHETPAPEPAPAPTPTQGAEAEKKSVLELSLDDLF